MTLGGLLFTLVFTGPRARVAHLLHPLSSPNWPDLTLCRATPPGLWWGTGSWDEMERAKSLPLCRKCKAIAKAYEVAGDEP